MSRNHPFLSFHDFNAPVALTKWTKGWRCSLETIIFGENAKDSGIESRIEYMKELLFATGNLHKAQEIGALLGENFTLKSLADVGFTGDIPEECDTLEGNALSKAHFVYDLFHTPCFADDTGLEVQALKGAPGVFSARYAGVDGSMAVKSEANIRKLLDELENHTDRSARFRTVIAYFDGSQEWLFEGEVHGAIIHNKRGREGFGYDPVFVPLGFSQTFAEMPLEIKNTISHRARAFQKFLSFLNG